MPKVSIIVPVYNVEKLIGECIESIIQQTYKDFELILVVDGSPDNSLNICQSYAEIDSRIRVINKENGGVSSARNLGLNCAIGDWIVFVDSDDWVTPLYLEVFDFENSNGFDLIMSGVTLMNHKTGTETKSISFEQSQFDSFEFKEKFLSNNILMNGFPIAKAYKKILIDKYRIRFNQQISFHEDHIFVFDYLLVCHSIKLCDKQTYRYRIYHSEKSLTNKKHPWEPLYLSSLMMIERLNALRIKFKIDETRPEYIRCLSFCYEPIISSIISVYDSQLKRKKRKNILKNILSKRKELYKYYCPTDIKGKIILYITCKTPFIILDSFYILLNKYYNRNK